MVKLGRHCSSPSSRHACCTSTYRHSVSFLPVATHIQIEQENCNLEREYRDCIKSRKDKIGITRRIMMHQVLYVVQLPNEEGDMHII